MGISTNIGIASVQMIHSPVTQGESRNKSNELQIRNEADKSKDWFSDNGIKVNRQKSKKVKKSKKSPVKKIELAEIGLQTDLEEKPAKVTAGN